LGLSYFFHRNVGIEGYGYTESTDHNWVDNVGGNLIDVFRFCKQDWRLTSLWRRAATRSVVPMVLGRGRRSRMRFARHVGVFVDGRYVWADKTKDYGLGRLGVKFGF